MNDLTVISPQLTIRLRATGTNMRKTARTWRSWGMRPGVNSHGKLQCHLFVRISSSDQSLQLLSRWQLTSKSHDAVYNGIRKRILFDGVSSKLGTSMAIDRHIGLTFGTLSNGQWISVCQGGAVKSVSWLLSLTLVGKWREVQLNSPCVFPLRVNQLRIVELIIYWVILYGTTILQFLRMQRVCGINIDDWRQTSHYVFKGPVCRYLFVSTVIIIFRVTSQRLCPFQIECRWIHILYILTQSFTSLSAFSFRRNQVTRQVTHSLLLHLSENQRKTGSSAVHVTDKVVNKPTH